jgi:hypothetical protein
LLNQERGRLAADLAALRQAPLLEALQTKNGTIAYKQQRLAACEAAIIILQQHHENDAS